MENIRIKMNIIEFKENLIESLDIDHFVTLQNGSLVEVFGNISNENVRIRNLRFIKQLNKKFYKI